MNDREVEDGSGRPLTRREIRAREAAAAEAAAVESPLLDEPPASAEEPVPSEHVGGVERPVAAEPTPDAPDPWALAVDWSLRHELPRELPPEPEVDDVRWDPVEAAAVTGGHPAVPARTSAFARSSTAQTDADAGDREVRQDDTVVLRPDELPYDEYADDDHDADAHLGEGRRGDERTDHERTDHERSDAENSGDEHHPDEHPDAEHHPGEHHPGDEHQPRDVVTDGATAGAAQGATAHVPERSEGHWGPSVGGGGADPARPGSEGQAAGSPFGPVTPGPSHGLPTLTDLLATRPDAPAGPAETGWQGVVRRLTGGRVAPQPGRAEQHRRTAVATVQRSLDGPKTIVVINPKGGAHKTTATLLLAATFGRNRGGYTLAWDNNETRGTLGWRSHQAHHHNTAVNLLQDLDRFSDPGSARVGDLDNYVRPQGSAQFDVLASDEDAASAASIDAFAFRALHRTLSRFYRVMLIDTGNNMRASNWQAAIDAADQVVIVSTVREDTAQSAAWAVDALRATGHEDLVRRAVTVLTAPAVRRDDALAARLHEHFSALTRVVLDVPYDPALVAGSPLDYDALSDATRNAWLRVAAAVAEGL